MYVLLTGYSKIVKTGGFIISHYNFNEDDISWKLLLTGYSRSFIETKDSDSKYVNYKDFNIFSLPKFLEPS